MGRYDKSDEMLKRALKTIPLGSQTFSKSKVQFAPGSSPLFLSHGKGSRVWDVDGNEYLDFVNGLLPVLLGYCDPDVDNAVKEQLGKGVSFSLATELEIELAETLVDIIPCAEMVRFGKNGSDVTAGAIRLARHVTGKEHVAVCGYHGWQDWYIGSTSMNGGVPKGVRSLTHTFTYNNIESLEKLFSENSHGYAAVIMEPMNVEEPKDGFLQKVKDLAHRNGALFILDEIITGFRFHLGGAQTLYGVTPDLATFGKSMANGFPVSAVVGRAEYMKEMANIFFSFTFGGEALSIAAALAVIKKMKREPVIETLHKRGSEIFDGVSRLIGENGLEKVISIKGKPCWSLLQFSDTEVCDSWTVKSLFLQEMFEKGILTIGSNNMSYAHSSEDVAKALDAYVSAMKKISDGLKTGKIAKMLKAEPIRPLFKVR
ncbi:MAG: aminotransferase class III-fold pyridoxal phosphate-dependent enzyme [Nitrospinota bacterium]|nr:aminotransferase class III-fold pyridoxal phosphate-dependent enzyme [Nitrospinota bacterium]